MKNLNTAILIVAIFTILTGGCSKTAPKICGSKEVEQELVKKATDQGLIPKELLGKINFTVLKIEQSSGKPSSKDPSAEIVCTAEGKLDFIEDIQKSYAEVKKAVAENFPFAKNYFLDDLFSFKLISYKVKKNQLNDGVIVDGDWMEKSPNGESASEPAKQLPLSVIKIIEKKEKIYSDLKDVAQIYDFRAFILDEKNDVARSGKQVREYVLNNKIPVLQCLFVDFKPKEDFFVCRVAGERAAFNIDLSYEDSDQVIAEVLGGKKPSTGTPIRDERIEELLSMAKYVKYSKDSFEVFKVTVFSEIEHIKIK